MSHWAEIDQNNIVTRVLVGSNNDPDEGYSWLINNLGGTWVKTSYNAVGGKKRNPETGEVTEEIGFRKNYAGVGYVWDEKRDAFIPPKPYESWILNEDTCLWDAPKPYPSDGLIYTWDEERKDWSAVVYE